MLFSSAKSFQDFFLVFHTNLLTAVSDWWNWWKKWCVPFPLGETGGAATHLGGGMLESELLPSDAQILSLADAFSHANSVQKLVVVYVHSELMSSANQFVHEVKEDEVMLEMLAHDFVFYPTSILRGEAWRLLSSHHRMLPCFIVFLPSNCSAELAVCEGPHLAVMEVKMFLMQCRDVYSSVLSR